MPLLVATLEGDVIPLGRSWFRRAAHSVASAGRATGHVAATAGRAAERGVESAGKEIGHSAAVTGRVVRRGAKTAVSDVGHAAAVTGRVARRSALTVGHGAAVAGRTVGHGVAVAGRAVGHAAASIGRIAYREAKRLIRAVARPIVASMLHGEEAELFGADDPQAAAQFLRNKRKEIIGSVTGAATGAVVASGVAAPAAPAVPILLPPIIDELIDEIAKKGRAILNGRDSNPDPNTPDPAAGTIPDSDGGAGGIMSAKIAGIPVPLLAVGGVAAFLLLRRKDK